ncbi:MAG TPA: antibiotic biosynthesis monooxygenase [Anaerolineales bacterium]|nr:antibiotic biosynthesis monooxygenase [Anaerolineales bacterium]
MNDNVIVIGDMSIKSGEFENFKALVNEMVETTKANEPNTMIYEFYINEDNKHCQTYERYVDSAALLTHIGNFGEKYAERLWAIAESKGFSVYGNLSDELFEITSRAGAVFLTPFGGFVR